MRFAYWLMFVAWLGCGAEKADGGAGGDTGTDGDTDIDGDVDADTDPAPESDCTDFEMSLLEAETLLPAVVRVFFRLTNCEGRRCPA